MKYLPALFSLLFLLSALLPAVAQTMPGMRMPASAAPQPPRTAPAPKATPAMPSVYQPDYIGKRVAYDLYVTDTLVNFTGKVRTAVVLNGRLPGPTLQFVEGDTAVVRVHNRLKGATSMHWHGLILPNKEDGVPYLTTAPVLPGSTHTFTFPLIQHGTYWYHAHGLEEQSGMYGSMVIQPRETKPVMKEYVLLLSDWTDQKPAEVLRYLKRAGEWYAVQKGATQSYGEAIAASYFKDKVKQEWGRMPAMDVSDVFYNKFLMNGREQAYFKDAKPGEVVRLRIINGGTSSYFHLQYAGGPMQVIAADGNDVVPFPVTKLEIATAETYDLLITVPPIGAAELAGYVLGCDGLHFRLFWQRRGYESARPAQARLLPADARDEPNGPDDRPERQRGRPDEHDQVRRAGREGPGCAKRRRHEGHEYAKRPRTGRARAHPRRPANEPARTKRPEHGQFTRPGHWDGHGWHGR